MSHIMAATLALGLTWSQDLGVVIIRRVNMAGYVFPTLIGQKGDLLMGDGVIAN